MFFPIHSKSVQGLVFVNSMKIFWILRQDLSCYVFYFVVKMFVTTTWRHNHFWSAFWSIVHVISTELRAWRHLSLLLERVFNSFAWICFWSHMTYLAFKINFLTLKVTFLILRSMRKSQVSVYCSNSGYLRAANWSIIKSYRFIIKI